MLRSPLLTLSPEVSLLRARALSLKTHAYIVAHPPALSLGPCHNIRCHQRRTSPRSPRLTHQTLPEKFSYMWILTRAHSCGSFIPSPRNPRNRACCTLLRHAQSTHAPAASAVTKACHHRSNRIPRWFSRSLFHAAHLCVPHFAYLLAHKRTRSRRAPYVIYPCDRTNLTGRTHGTTRAVELHWEVINPEVLVLSGAPIFRTVRTVRARRRLEQLPRMCTLVFTCNGPGAMSLRSDESWESECLAFRS